MNNHYPLTEQEANASIARLKAETAYLENLPKSQRHTALKLLRLQGWSPNNLHGNISEVKV
jgi:hypothetical protein